LSSGRNIYEELGEGFTLIDLGSNGAASAFEQAAAELHVPLKVVKDSASGGREKYQASVILVRPDQYVSWASDKESGDKAEAARVLRRAIGSGK
jgi:4-hydroxyisophthalate hydroxylase